VVVHHALSGTPVVRLATVSRVRILLGTVDIGYRLPAYARLLRRKYGTDVDVTSVVIYRPPANHFEAAYDREYDYFAKPTLLRWCLSGWNFVRFASRNDAFLFLSGETLLPRRLRRLELWLYRLRGKHVAMGFVGSDIRSERFLRAREERYLHGKASDAVPMAEPWQRKLIDDAERFADSILVSTPDLCRLVDRAVHVPVTVDVEELMRLLTPAAPDGRAADVVRLLHVAYNPRTKGSEAILQVMSRVKRRWGERVLLLAEEEQRGRGTPGYAIGRYDMLRLVGQADVVIDQMVSGWYGMVSIEALLAGKYAVCHIDPDLSSCLPPECPIVSADLSSLEACLNDLVRDVLDGRRPDQRRQVAWVQNHHSLERHQQKLLLALGLES
jgi:hypothetical protein